MSRLRLGLNDVGLGTPLAVGALELTHPTWTNGSIAQAVTAAGGWWIPLHVLLIAGSNLVAWLLWYELPTPSGRAETFARVLLLAFALDSTAFLALDGVVVGLLAPTDPGAADSLWNSPFVAALANLTGATWSAAVLSVAGALYPTGRVATVGLTATYLAFVASAPPLALPLVVSRLTALGTGAWVSYSRGPSAAPFALLAFAAVLRQHVGPEAALGMLLVFAALMILRLGRLRE